MSGCVHVTTRRLLHQLPNQVKSSALTSHHFPNQTEWVLVSGSTNQRPAFGGGGLLSAAANGRLGNSISGWVAITACSCSERPREGARLQHAATLRETRITHTHRHQAEAVLSCLVCTYTSNSALKMKVRHFGEGWPQKIEYKLLSSKENDGSYPKIWWRES